MKNLNENPGLRKPKFDPDGEQLFDISNHDLEQLLYKYMLWDYNYWLYQNDHIDDAGKDIPELHLIKYWSK